MSVERLDLQEFAGGQVQGRHSTEFPEETWARLKGVVVEDSGVLRSQYGMSALMPTDARVISLVEVGDAPTLLVREHFGGWKEAPAAGGWDASGGTAVTSLPQGGTALTVVPAPRTGLGFRRAALVMTGPPDPAYLWTREDGQEVVTAVSDRYPNDTESDTMPVGECAAMWGDFLVLGAIYWADDEGAPFTSNNERFYGNGLWFSQPGNVLRWDPIDIQFVGLKQQGGDPHIRDLIVHEYGLMVVTDAGTWLLRGDPSDHEIDFLGAVQFEKAALWGGADGTVGIADGDLWFLSPDGQPQRIALPDLDLDVVDVAAWRDQVWISTSGDRLFVGRLLPDRGVAWTELVPQAGTIGDYWLWPSSAGMYVGDQSALWFFDPYADAARGTYVDGEGATQKVTASVVSPTLSSGANRVDLWRSFSAALRGAGELVEARAHAGAGLDPEATVTAPGGPQQVSGRTDVEWLAAGPSHEAAFSFDIEGDVIVEACAVYVFPGGMDDR